MKKQAIKIVGTIVIVGGMVFFASGAGAQEISGKMNKTGFSSFARMQKPGMPDGHAKFEDMKKFHHIDPEQAEAIRNALDSKDYETWKTLVAEREENLPEGAKSLLKKIDSQEAFEKFADQGAEKKAAWEAGKVMKEKVQEAIENNDYEAWKVLIAEREEAMPNLKFSMLEKIDSVEDFSKLVHIHELQNEIHKIREDLGLLDLARKTGQRIGQR